MERNNPIKKGVVVAVILLFIGLAFAPSINANVSKESELVEFTTEVCGIDGVQPNTVSLSKEDALEVEQLIDDIERRLDEVETREEAVEIFNEAVVELDKYGLLGRLSVKQAQRLITGGQKDSSAMELMEKIHRRFRGISNSNENMFCLIIGETNETYFEGRVALFLERLYLFAMFLGPFWFLYLIIWGWFFGVWSQKIPISLVNRINLGYVDDEFEVDFVYYYSYGWVTSIGMNGLKSYDGIMRGDLPLDGASYMSGPITIREHYPAVAGFTGIKLFKSDTEGTLYIGFALWVKIEEIN